MTDFCDDSTLDTFLSTSFTEADVEDLVYKIKRHIKSLGSVLVKESKQIKCNEHLISELRKELSRLDIARNDIVKKSGYKSNHSIRKNDVFPFLLGLNKNKNTPYKRVVREASLKQVQELNKQIETIRTKLKKAPINTYKSLKNLNSIKASICGLHDFLIKVQKINRNEKRPLNSYTVSEDLLDEVTVLGRKQWPSEKLNMTNSIGMRVNGVLLECVHYLRATEEITMQLQDTERKLCKPSVNKDYVAYSPVNEMIDEIIENISGRPEKVAENEKEPVSVVGTLIDNGNDISCFHGKGEMDYMFRVIELSSEQGEEIVSLINIAGSGKTNETQAKSEKDRLDESPDEPPEIQLVMTDNIFSPACPRTEHKNMLDDATTITASSSSSTCHRSLSANLVENAISSNPIKSNNTSEINQKQSTFEAPYGVDSIYSELENIKSNNTFGINQKQSTFEAPYGVDSAYSELDRITGPMKSKNTFGISQKQSTFDLLYGVESAHSAQQTDQKQLFVLDDDISTSTGQVQESGCSAFCWKPQAINTLPISHEPRDESCEKEADDCRFGDINIIGTKQSETSKQGESQVISQEVSQELVLVLSDQKSVPCHDEEFEKKHKIGYLLDNSRSDGDGLNYYTNVSTE